MLETAADKLKNRLLRLFQHVLDVFPPLLSHSGWGAATAEFQTKAIGDLSRALDKKKLGSKSSLQNKHSSFLNSMFYIFIFFYTSWIKNCVCTAT